MDVVIFSLNTSLNILQVLVTGVLLHSLYKNFFHLRKKVNKTRGQVVPGSLTKVLFHERINPFHSDVFFFPITLIQLVWNSQFHIVRSYW